MAGTKAGGLLAAQVNKAKYGDDFYARIGAKGGSTTTKTPKGFAHSKAHGMTWHVEAGRKGGFSSHQVPEYAKHATVKVGPAETAVPQSWFKKLIHRHDSKYPSLKES